MGECKILDPLVSDYLPGLNELEDDQSSSDEEEEMEEHVRLKLNKKDKQIEKYKAKIKKLKEELSETKRTLKFTQRQHCKAARERLVYRELTENYKDNIKELHEEINGKNEKLMNLSEQNITLKNALIETKRFLRLCKNQLIEARNLHTKILQHKKVQNDEEEMESCSLCGQSTNSTQSNSQWTINDFYTLKNGNTYNQSKSPMTVSSVTPRSDGLNESSMSSFASQGNCYGNLRINYDPNRSRENSVSNYYHYDNYSQYTNSTNDEQNYEIQQNDMDITDNNDNDDYNMNGVRNYDESGLSCSSTQTFVSDNHNDSKKIKRKKAKIKDSLKKSKKRRSKECGNRDTVKVSQSSAASIISGPGNIEKRRLIARDTTRNQNQERNGKDKKKYIVKKKRKSKRKSGSHSV